MTISNNGKTIALVIIIVIMALFAFRSIFFVLPFGVPPRWFPAGIAHGIGSLPLILLPVGMIILWGAVLIWVYRDAEKRGMSGILWLLLVLIGNVIGLLIYAIVRSETPIRRRAEGGGAGESGSQLEKCLGCGSPLATAYAFCPHCGRSLKKTCPACGKPVEERWKACPACGTSLDPSATHQG